MRPSSLPAALASAFALALCACGARTGLHESLPPDALALDAFAPPDAPALDVAALPDAPAPPDAPDAGPCHWVAGREALITPPRIVGDRFLGGSISVPEGALVTWNIDNDPASDYAWYVQRLGPSGELLGDPHALMSRPPNTSYSTAAIADHGGTRAVLAWDETNGCRFVPLAADGAPAATPVADGRTICGRLLSTAEGFTFLEDVPGGAGSPIALVAVDPAGRVTHRVGPLVAPAMRPFWTSRRALDVRGSFGFAWMPGEIETRSVVARAFDPLGAPLGPEHTLATLTTDASRVAVLPLATGALVAWTELEGPTDQFHRLVALRTDVDLAPMSMPAPLADVHLYRDAGFSLLADGDGMLAAWVDSASPDGTRVMLRGFDRDGTPRGDAVQVSPGDHLARYVTLLRTSAGLLAVYETSAPSVGTDLAVVPLTCAR